MHSRISAGFSLLEVMLVTAMIAVLAGAGWPALQRSLQQQQLLSSAELIYAAVRDARLAAIVGGIDWRFGETGTRELCFWPTELIPAACGQSEVGGPSSVKLQRLPEFITVSVHFNQQPAVRFSAHSGMAGFSAGRFEITHQQLNNTVIKIIVSSLGRIRMCAEGERLSRVPRC